MIHHYLYLLLQISLVKDFIKMANILAIDTTTSSCSAALSSGDELITKCNLAERSHTKLILPMIDEVLSKSSLTLDKLDYIAFTAGPGSFTGIRIGFGIVQGLAYGANIPVLPVSSLETLAYTAIRKLKIKEDLNIVPIIDARMNEIYWAKFSYKSGILSRDSKDCVTSPQFLRDSIELPVILIGNVIDYNDQTSENTLDLDHIVMLPEAQDVLNMAQLQLKKGSGIDVQEVSPIYLRNNIKWKKRKKLRKT